MDACLEKYEDPTVRPDGAWILTCQLLSVASHVQISTGLDMLGALSQRAAKLCSPRSSGLSIHLRVHPCDNPGFGRNARGCVCVCGR